MIYFARHGESLANQEGYFAGHIDSPLTSSGRVQAAEIGVRLMDAVIEVDTLVTSPIMRAQDSAQIVAEKIGYPSEKIEIDHRIIEYDFGDLTGVTKLGVDHERFYAAVGRESSESFRERVNEALLDYSQREGSAVIIGHSFVQMMMRCIANNGDYMRFNELPSDPKDNGVLNKIEF